MNPVFAAPLADTSITIKQLDKLSEAMPGKALNIALKWMIANCSAHSLATEIVEAASQVYKVVDAVKKFTYVDNLAVKNFIEIEPGIRDTLSVLMAKVKSKNAAIRFNMDANLPTVYANGSDLNQVWFCLLDNALDAISESGNICIKACTELNRVIVQIIDDGQGISSKVISNIFDPFYTTKSPGQGTGLGLDIARRLLRRYQGDISVRSQPGQTEFQVSLLINK